MLRNISLFNQFSQLNIYSIKTLQIVQFIYSFKLLNIKVGPTDAKILYQSIQGKGRFTHCTALRVARRWSVLSINFKTVQK